MLILATLLSSAATCPPASPVPPTATSTCAPALDELDWRERLFPPAITFEELALFRFTPDDLERSERESPAQRIERLGERLQAGEADPRLRLEYAGALAEAGQRSEAHALFGELATELGGRIAQEESNWELAGLYGEVLVGYGDAFRSLERLQEGEGVLQRVLEADPSQWQAAKRLCAVHLRQAIALRAAGDDASADRALELARSFGARAVEAAPEEFSAHRARFLARWAWVGRGESLETALEAIEGLRAVAELSPEPDWTAAMADALEGSLLLGAGAPARTPEEAFGGLPEALRARPATLDPGLSRLEAHPQVGPSARRLRWLLELYAAGQDEEVLFEAALAQANDPAELLEGRLGLLARRAPMDALEALEQRLIAARADARTQDLLASVDLARGAFDDALAHYRASLELDAEGSRAAVGMAVALLRAGAQPSGPRSLLEPLIAGESPSVAALFALGTALALEGEREPALELLARAREQAPLEQRPLIEATLEELRTQ